MDDNELTALVRENYVKANADYIAEQIAIASKYLPDTMTIAVKAYRQRVLDIISERERECNHVDDYKTANALADLFEDIRALKIE